MKLPVVDESLSVSIQSFIWRKFNYIMLNQQNEKSFQISSSVGKFHVEPVNIQLMDDAVPI